MFVHHSPCADESYLKYDLQNEIDTILPGKSH